jgi:hypothetical protein
MRHTDRAGKRPHILKSFVTACVRDLRNGDVLYVFTQDQVDAIKDVLAPYEKLDVGYSKSLGYQLKLEEK